FPKNRLLPIILFLTLTAIYVQETSMLAIWITIFFGLLGYVMRRVGMSPLPFVIAFILAGNLEATARQAFAATGADPFFLLKSPIAFIFIVLAIFVVAYNLRRPLS
ncbi:MAG: tripartite tricarboxylate transporter permease, partial [Rhodobacteraceae bacterium]|nr:tripartite tricarboxylate transporter permease [Paracoccaceae bacterium]